MTASSQPVPNASPPPRSDLWQPRQASVQTSVAQYSKFVMWMKRGLVAAAVTLLLLVFVLPQFRGDDSRFKVGPETIKDDKGEAVDTLSMVNARYFGTDAKGQPFTVTADTVRQRQANAAEVELTAPKADISLVNGTWLAVDAKTGLYDRTKEVLDLTDGVNLFQDQGYEIHTNSARVFLKEGKASGSEPVNGQGPFGTLQASGFELSDTGRNVLLTGQVHLVINSGTDIKPAAAAPAAPSSGATKAAPKAAPAGAP